MEAHQSLFAGGRISKRKKANKVTFGKSARKGRKPKRRV